MNRILFLIVPFICILSFNLQAAPTVQSKTTIRGIVKDSLTGEPLPFISVYVFGTTIGGMTDDHGNFSFTSHSIGDVVVVKSLGYIEKQTKIKIGEVNNLVIKILPQSYQVKEVVVKPRKEKYKKKGNPAVELAENVIKHKNDNSPYNHDFYNHERYEKITLALNDFSEKQKKQWLFRKFQFIFNYVDTSEVSGKPILTLSVKEKIANDYFRKNPSTKKTVITGEKQVGIDDIVSQEAMQTFLNEILKDVNIFDNNIPLFLQQFVSPLSSIGTSYYKYYIMDTVMVRGEKCVDLGFVPFNSESFGFTGHMYITLDSTYFVKQVKLNVPKDINLNFIEHLTIMQDYERSKDGTRLPFKDDLIAEFKLVPGTQGMCIRRTSTYRKHNFVEPADSTTIYAREGSVYVEEEADVKPDAFWVDNRHIAIKQKENAVDKILVQLREVPAFFYFEKILTVFVTNFIETGKNSKFDFGEMNTTLSFNNVEGARFRIGGQTTAALNPRWFAKGYVAYGVKDERFKYKFELEHSFNKKKNHALEFPIHSIRANYTYDINQLGQHYLFTNKDNVFLSLKRAPNYLSTYLRKAELAYLREHRTGFSYGATLHYNTEYESPYVKFLTRNNGVWSNVSSYNVGSMEIKLRYAPDEKYYQTKSNRYAITKNAPVFMLTQQIGAKGIFGSDYNFNKTEFSAQKRFWLSPVGYTDIILRASKIWNKSPFPLLLAPNANLSYTIQPESFACLNPLEFVNDRLFSWDMSYYMNGTLFNRIPLVQYMKLREVFTFRGFFGSLSDKNNPENTDGLFKLPEGTKTMDKDPYMEVGVGLENIFRILRIDYVWRLTYLDKPNIDKRGLRIALRFNF